MSKTLLRRRQFLQCGVCGLTGIALGPLGPWGAGASQAAEPPPGQGVSLSFEEALVQMVDFNLVYHWLFKLEGSEVPSFPGPVIFVSQGDPISITLTNNLDEAHAFEVQGVPESNSGVLAPGASRTVTFIAPRAGTYLYLDPLNAPVNRVMGLHGAFIVLPQGVRENTAVNTPYSDPTAKVQRLFDDLGTTGHFPGDPWIPIRPATAPENTHLPPAIERFLYRTRVWLCTQVDPFLNDRVHALPPGALFDPARFQREFLPRYFLINGRSGVFAAHDPMTRLEGFIGEPHLVRQLNAGLAAPSNHLHANHFYVLAIDRVVQENVTFLDSMTLTAPGERSGLLFFVGGNTVDWLVPFIRPPDIPGDPNTPLRDLLREELALILGDVPQSPLRYPMHNHTEQSQTAAGGNYPQGDITDLTFLGDLDKIRFPKSSVDAGRGGPNSGRDTGKSGSGRSDSGRGEGNSGSRGGNSGSGRGNSGSGRR